MSQIIWEEKASHENSSSLSPPLLPQQTPQGNTSVKYQHLDRLNPHEGANRTSRMSSYSTISQSSRQGATLVMYIFFLFSQIQQNPPWEETRSQISTSLTNNSRRAGERWYWFRKEERSIWGPGVNKMDCAESSWCFIFAASRTM